MGPAYDDHLNEQVSYYDARARQYDDWWARRNSYDFGHAYNQAWRRDIRQLSDWLDLAELGSPLLEIACGTGWWTQRLVERGIEVTALDASRNMLDLCKQRLQGVAEIEFLEMDVFDLRPTGHFQSIFSAFWISHIPRSAWVAHWGLMRGLLNGSGSVFLIESAHPNYAFSNGPPGTPRPSAEDGVAGGPLELRTRTVSDGQQFVINKRYWTPESLRGDLAAHGWSVDVRNTEFAFLVAECRPTGD